MDIFARNRQGLHVPISAMTEKDMILAYAASIQVNDQDDAA